MSKDYRPQVSDLATTPFEKSLRAGGWFRFKHDKLKNSLADIWSLILVLHERTSKQAFINFEPRELLEKLIAIHGKKDVYDIHPWILDITDEQGETKKICIDGRGLRTNEKALFAQGNFDSKRSFIKYLNNWDFLDDLRH